MITTVEVRWFFKGAIPPAVWDWYKAWGWDLAGQPPRVDYYLRMNNDDALGVKLREGRIELKQRDGSQDVVRFGERAAGMVETWRKWSFALAETTEFLSGLRDRSSSWIGVEKHRQLRTYQVTEDESLVAIFNDGTLGQGCGWEIVQVQLAGTQKQWWSVGFEAFGDQSERADLILKVARRILAGDRAPALGIEASYGYPKWLQNAGGSV